MTPRDGSRRPVNGDIVHETSSIGPPRETSRVPVSGDTTTELVLVLYEGDRGLRSDSCCLVVVEVPFDTGQLGRSALQRDDWADDEVEDDLTPAALRNRSLASTSSLNRR